jgi:hypothetical protein
LAAFVTGYSLDFFASVPLFGIPIWLIGHFDFPRPVSPSSSSSPFFACALQKSLFAMLFMVVMMVGGGGGFVRDRSTGDVAYLGRR